MKIPYSTLYMRLLLQIIFQLNDRFDFETVVFCIVSLYVLKKQHLAIIIIRKSKLWKVLKKMALFVDSNILFDAKECNVYKEFLASNNNVYIEATMFKNEILTSIGYREELVNCGLKTFDMTDDEFNIATTIYNNNIHLSYYDCIAYTVSKIRNWILVTGDERLRKFATKNGVQVHGFIWALQQCNLSEEKIKQILNQIASGENMRRIPLNIFLNVFFPNK